VLVTRPRSSAILSGVTRAEVMKLAESAQIRLEERPFTLAEAKVAREAFVTSASSILLSVTSLDGQPVGEGVPGPIARRLRSLYEGQIA
jgi:D-alanine transaminase